MSDYTQRCWEQPCLEREREGERDKSELCAQCDKRSKLTELLNISVNNNSKEPASQMYLCNSFNCRDNDSESW